MRCERKTVAQGFEQFIFVFIGTLEHWERTVKKEQIKTEINNNMSINKLQYNYFR